MHLHHCTNGDVLPALVHSVTSVRGFVKMVPHETHHEDRTVVRYTPVAPLGAPHGGTILQPLLQRGCGRAQMTVACDGALVAPGHVGHREAHRPGELGA